MRYPFLDTVRVLACFLVVLLHVAATNFYQFSPAWTIHVIYDGISRMCVPLFFMISGFLLLDSPIDNLRGFYLKRCRRIFVPYFILALLYWPTPPFRNFSAGEYLFYILNDHIDYHLWYIYVLVGLYFALPFFIKIIHGENGEKLALLYTATWLAGFVCVSFFMRWLKIDNDIYTNLNFHYVNGGPEYALYEMGPNIFINFNFLFFYGFMGYILCGWHIKKLHGHFNTTVHVLSALVWLAATLGIIAGTISWSHAQNKPDELFFDNLSPLVFLQTTTFFILASAIRKTGAITRDLADKSFWIYLIHLLALRPALQLFPIPPNNWAWLAIPLETTAIFGACYLAAIPLKRLENFLLGIFSARGTASRRQ